MAGLDDLDVNEPTGDDDPGSGGGDLGADNQLRIIKTKVKDFASGAAGEHHNTGEHRFLIIPTGSIPAGKDGQVVIVKDPGVVYELKGYDADVPGWVDLTYNAEAAAAATALEEHRTLVPIDHPNNSITTAKYQNDSVTAAKIAAGNILKEHLDAVSADPSGSCANLVNGGSADALHNHDQYEGGGSSSSMSITATGPWSGTPANPSYATDTTIYFWYPGNKTEIIARCTLLQIDAGNPGSYLRLKIGGSYSQELFVAEGAGATVVSHAVGDGVSVSSLTANTWCSVEVQTWTPGTQVNVTNLLLTLI